MASRNVHKNGFAPGTLSTVSKGSSDFGNYSQVNIVWASMLNAALCLGLYRNYFGYLNTKQTLICKGGG